jgi:hypothetical protein
MRRDAARTVAIVERDPTGGIGGIGGSERTTAHDDQLFRP